MTGMTRLGSLGIPCGLAVLLLASMVRADDGAASPDMVAERLFRGEHEVASASGRMLRLSGCRDCHGRDGAGGREGNVVAPPISAIALSRSALGRPAYDEASFALALREGIGADGRAFRAIMPRYELSPKEARALWGFLAGLDESERRGVGPDRIRIGIDMRAGTRLFERLVSSPVLSGQRIHGRSIAFVPVSGPADIETEGILALLLATDLSLRRSDGGLPLLFPIPALDEPTRADEARSMVPSRRDQAEALLSAADPDSPVMADEAGRALLAPSSRRPVIDAGADARAMTPLPREIVILVDPSLWPGLVGRLPAGIRIHAIGQEAAPVLPDLARAGFRVTMTEPTLGPNVLRAGAPIERFAATAAVLLRSALVAAGRDLTRGSLLRAFDAIRLDGEDWPNLDYARYPRTGRRQVELLRSE